MCELAADLLLALDPVELARTVGLEPDPWQKALSFAKTPSALRFSDLQSIYGNLYFTIERVDCAGQPTWRHANRSRGRHKPRQVPFKLMVSHVISIAHAADEVRRLEGKRLKAREIRLWRGTCTERVQLPANPLVLELGSRGSRYALAGASGEDRHEE